MSDTVISVEKVSKAYRLGQIGGGTLKEDFSRWWAKLRGKPDPFLKIGEEHHSRKMGEQFWALDDVSFQVKQGEVLGIIGRNGAGKSTLLKILSQVTMPSSGRIKVKGRIASLLEVGTGFHPELTGRENVFLNGAILGMTKAEIRKKFDEIVAFSEIEEFINTPVKRYSSGMYVRLAFAVAAHLEPEILICDEVLAVGDIEFQNKCMGKMKDVSERGGRTVLFVSHNMTAMKALASRSVLMHAGRAVYDAPTDAVVSKYLEMSTKESTRKSVTRNEGKHAIIKSVRLLDEAGKATNFYIPGTPFCLEIGFSTDGTRGMSVELFLTDDNNVKLALSSLHQFHGVSLPSVAGNYIYKLYLNPLWLASGNYNLDIATSIVNKAWDHQVDRIFDFTVPFSNPSGISWDFKRSYGYGSYAWLANKPPEFVNADNL
jgi:lipopolysaccharide transport system ATP-binding protein